MFFTFLELHSNIAHELLMSVKKKDPKNFTGFQAAMIDIMSGTVGGIAQVAAGHPLDTVKVRMQTQPKENPLFSGMIDCFAKTIKNEGIGALYKGAASPIAGAMAHNAGLFFVNGQTKRLVKNLVGKSSGQNLSVSEFFLSGLMTGFIVTIVESPVDLLKCKLQAQVGKGEYSGVFDALRKIYWNYGIRGLYQGAGSVALRNTPCFASYFTGYEYTKSYFTPPGEVPSLAVCFLGGAVAGFLFWGVYYPLDVVKTKMQTDHIDKSKRIYEGTLDCFRQTYRNGGIGNFYKGYVPSTIRGVFVNAAIFWAVNLAKRALEAG